MRLLIVTQTIDREDPYLGFFHEWVAALAPRYVSIIVICLYEGTHALPENVSVYSLGKESGKRGKAGYALRFLSLIGAHRHAYDRVFVHMNEEYVLIGGLLWKGLRKPVYLWRNHYRGSLLTTLAASLSKKVFYTSAHSYTARFNNAVQMPVGVDTTRFTGARTAPVGSILFLARFSPSKRPHTFIEALGLLKARGIAFSASVYGPTLPEDEGYREEVIARAGALGLDTVSFYGGVPHAETPTLYRTHEVYVNLAASGMLDKALFEAAASGAQVLARSEDWRARSGGRGYISSDSPEALADALEEALRQGAGDMRALLASESLEALVPALAKEMA